MNDERRESARSEGAVAARKRRPGPAGARLLSLDLLRVLAVVLVLFHHAHPAWLAALPVPRAAAQGFLVGGWIGVDLFFVLSGYLVSGLLFKEYLNHGRLRVGSFLLRRGLKIYPAFYFFLAVTVLVPWIQRGRIPSRTWSEALFLQSYFGGNWGHTWSLAVEEHFYLALPVLLLFLIRFGPGRERPLSVLPKVCLSACVAILALRTWQAVTVPYEPITHFKPTHLRADALLFGVVLAYLHHFRTQEFESFCRKYWAYMLVGGLWLWIPAFLSNVRSDPFLYSLGFTQIYVGAGLILAALVVRGVPRNRWTRSLAWIGTYSYSVYLWHLPFKKWGMVWIENLWGAPLSPAIALVVYLLGSLVLGVATSMLIEIPVLRLRDRVIPSRALRSRPRRRPVPVGVPITPRSPGTESGRPEAGDHEVAVR